MLEILLSPNLRALLAGKIWPDPDPDSEVPDFVLEEWDSPARVSR